jgi:hypothetical protein
MKYYFLLVTFILIHLSSYQSRAEDWSTYYEKSGFKKTPNYLQTINNCQKLDSASKWIKYTSFGKSPQGRDLPLLIVDKHANFTPEKVKASGNAIFLIQAGIHSGEIDGKDAGLMLIRDLVMLKKQADLLDNITLLFIPIFNVDGHERSSHYNRINQNGPEEMGWRVTAQNLNLNRDFMKADSPEMQQWLTLFNSWLPDFLVDCHVTDGADYQYVVTYGLEGYDNVAAPLRNLTHELVDPYLNKKMSKAGFPMFPYVMFRRWDDIRSGLRAGAASPRFSTGYGVIQNRIFLLIETHMLKDYQTRVSGTYNLLRSVMQLIHQYSGKLKEINLLSDQSTRNLSGKYLPLNMENSQNDSTILKFKGVEYDRFPSNISGKDWVVYHPDRNKTYQMTYFNRVFVKDSVLVPFAYLIPMEWNKEIERLKLHGIKISYLAKDTSLTVSSYKFSDIKWPDKSYEGRQQPGFEITPIEEIRDYPKGTPVVLLNQRTNRVIVNLLEPKAPDSFVSWGFWNVIFERKEYAEDYVLEKLAREMLERNPALKAEFEKKLIEDKSFASDPEARLNFFYRRSPYWDHTLNLYPVGKIMNPVSLPVVSEKKFIGEK